MAPGQAEALDPDIGYDDRGLFRATQAGNTAFIEAYSLQDSISQVEYAKEQAASTRERAQEYADRT